MTDRQYDALGLPERIGHLELEIAVGLTLEKLLLAEHRLSTQFGEPLVECAGEIWCLLGDHFRRGRKQISPRVRGYLVLKRAWIGEIGRQDGAWADRSLQGFRIQRSS